MGIIKVIRLNDVEDDLKEIVGLSFQIKLFQEEYEDVLNQSKTTKSSLSSGNISKDVYNRNRAILEKEMKRLVGKINDTVEKMKKVSENTQKTIRENTI